MLFVSLRGVQIGTEKLAINQRSGGQLCTRFLGSQVHADGSGPGSQVHAGLLLSPVRSIFCACVRLLCVFQFCVSHVRGPFCVFSVLGSWTKKHQKTGPFYSPCDVVQHAFVLVSCHSFCPCMLRAFVFLCVSCLGSWHIRPSAPRISA